MKTAASYGRYSEGRSQRQESISAQLRACREYAQRNGLKIVHEYYDEHVSGKGSSTQKRKQYLKMLADAQKHKFDVILIHKYDRVARSLYEHVNLASKLAAAGVELVAVGQDFGEGESKEAKLMRGLMWILSEFYSDNLADEVRKGMREDALNGLFNGGVPPFGYDVVDRRYVVNELEAAYVRKMFDCCLHGEPYRELISEMAAADIKGKRGRPIRYPSIYEILRNEKYTGVYSYTVVEEKDREARRNKKNAIRIEDSLPAIIDRKTWEKVQSIMTSRKNLGKASRHRYLLSGLVYCECGAPMHGTTTHRKKNGVEYEYPYYVCSKKCGRANVREDEAVKRVFDCLRMMLTAENKELLRDELQKYQKAVKGETAVNAAAIGKAVADKQKEIDSLLNNLSAAVLPAEVVQEIGQKISALRAQIDTLEAQRAEEPRTFDDKEILGYFKSIEDIEHQTYERQRAAIEWFLGKITIKENSVGVESTLTEFLGRHGCGGLITILPKLLLAVEISWKRAQSRS